MYEDKLPPPPSVWRGGGGGGGFKHPKKRGKSINKNYIQAKRAGRRGGGHKWRCCLSIVCARIRARVGGGKNAAATFWRHTLLEKQFTADKKHHNMSIIIERFNATFLVLIT